MPSLEKPPPRLPTLPANRPCLAGLSFHDDPPFLARLACAALPDPQEPDLSPGPAGCAGALGSGSPCRGNVAAAPTSHGGVAGFPALAGAAGQAGRRPLARRRLPRPGGQG